jgi:methionyl-tRNA formyltransferase
LKSLVALSGEGFELAGLLTRADSPKGRSGTPEPTECAIALGQLFTDPLPILKPEKLDSKAREQAAALNADLLVSFAYGKIFGPQFLSLFPFGGINIHPSLLPQYRGPTPIPAVILNRETVSGITIQKMAVEVDSGDILVQEPVALQGRETTVDLSKIMAEKAAHILPAALRGIADGTLRARPQDHGAATYCSLITKEDGFIDWNRSAAELDAQIRAFDPWPLSWTKHGDMPLFLLQAEALEGRGEPLPSGRPVTFSEKVASSGTTPGGFCSGSTLTGSRDFVGRVLGKDKDKGILIQTGEGILAVSRLQYQAKKALAWKDFLNGARNFMGARLGV